MNRLTVGLLLGLIAGVPAGAAIHAQFAENSALVNSSVPALFKSRGMADQWDSSSLKKAMDPTPAAQLAGEPNCTTTGPDSPIVTGENSVVAINGKTYASGQTADCAPASVNVSTHGVGSPIVTGAGAKVIIHTDR